MILYQNFKFQDELATVFLRKPNLRICHWNFANPCKDLGAVAKNIFLQVPIDILSGRTSYKGVWRCPTTQLLMVPRPCFSKMAAEDLRSGQSSSVKLYKEALDEARG